MKGEKMMSIYSDFRVMRDLIRLKEDLRLTSSMKDRIQILEQGLQLLVLYRICLTILDDPPFPWRKVTTFGEMPLIDATLEKKGLLETGLLALDSGEFQDWDTLSSELLDEIQSYKPTITEDCLSFSYCMVNCPYCMSNRYFSVYQLKKFIRYIIVSLDNILLLKGNIITDEKMKFESLKEKQDLFRKVLKFTLRHCNSDFKIINFKSTLKAWAWNTACVCLLNWVLDEKDESMAPKMDLILSKLQSNFNYVLPNVTRMCLSFLKATKPSANEHFKVGKLVSRFVEFLLGNLRGYVAKDGIEMLRNGMILLITFLMDPPEANDGQLILTQIAATVDDATSLIISLGSGEMNEAGIAEASNSLLQDFMGKVNTIKAEVRKIYPQLLLDSSSFNCPRINILRLFDTSIENLKEFSFNFSNHPILTVQEDLVFLRNLLKASNPKECFISELQNEHKLKDLWTRISNVVHQADRTIRSFIYLKSFLWVDMLCLFDVKEEIKHIQTEVKRIQDQHMHDIDDCRTDEMNLSPTISSKTNNVQTIDEVVVGFEDKVKYIRDWLTRGSEKLNIISIIGMAGMGKTTLAKKVYNDPSIKRHFTTCAWCTVSQSYDNKRLLLDILRSVTVVNDSFLKLDEGDLAHKLQQCLSGQKYLIVLDDIWDVGAWNALQLSFPDKNYSRILFTSRIHNVVSDAKKNCFPYHLSPLTEKESWELLERRLFHGKDLCPRDFVKVGKQIARDCKGLPLAIVLVSGLLKEKIENLDLWKQIGENLHSKISKEGCTHILELSYKQLPEHLKACFLYFGLFQEDKVIRVQKLTKLWVSEGFIQKQENVEIVAKDYVKDLVDRSLLIVSHKSSNGGIKACRIHDLLREFCLAKSEEENFFKLLHGNDASQLSKDVMNKHYRVCIQTQHWSSFLVWNSSPLHSLVVSTTSSFKPFGMDDSPFGKARFLQVWIWWMLSFLEIFQKK